MGELIRSLAKGGATIEALRRAVIHASPDSNIVLYQGLDGTARFPALCPNCGNPASSTLRIERAFLFHVQSGSDTPNDTLQSIDIVEAPFCESCKQQHRMQPTAPSPWTPLVRVLSEGEGLGGVVVLVIGCFFLKEAIVRLSVTPLILACLPLTVGSWLIGKVWKQSRHMAIPKPSTVDAAVDFTPYIHLEFEPPWRAFEFRSPPYAELFRQANAQQLWNPQSQEAQVARGKRQKQSFKSNLIVGAIVAAILLWMFWNEVVSKYVMPYLTR